MRIKFDQNLFNQEDIDCLTQTLKENNIDIQLIHKSAVAHKGLFDDPVAASWIAAIATAFLPVIVDIIYSYVKDRKEKFNIIIELRKADGTQKKITLPSDQSYSALEIEIGEDDDVRMFITKD